MKVSVNIQDSKNLESRAGLSETIPNGAQLKQKKLS